MTDPKPKTRAARTRRKREDKAAVATEPTYGLLPMGAPSGSEGLLLGSLGTLGSRSAGSWWDGPPALLRMYNPEAAAKWEAAVEQAKSDMRLGASQRIRETHALGHEPLWLAKAKALYSQVGTCLTLLSHHPDLPEWKLPDDVRDHCESFLRAFAEKVGNRNIELIERGVFLGLVDDAAHVKGAMANVKCSPAEGVLIGVGVLIGPAVGVRLLEPALFADLEKLVKAWPIEKPLGPNHEGKWVLAARIWSAAIGKTVTERTIRLFWQERKRSRRDVSADD